ncbi:glutathione S-transferase C-terminal domain-containing protein [Pigmentiphaga sp.]|uniref:glutathione S-transferase C-terminal domain-containing protein n=1 Tax=Pigmentiphaga sp. TaxID=1977564 RepID=UPI00128D8951|nr:glutathione S-transferase C-terminal domain-containing protein [Pigmentiphaga sp.]MPS29059.1 glutathione S-transferase [Alcaligenaceae bacterium SAGV5]MPS52773.1 glutathione S-transferase [Alcaligenaceae bacterium SAGV3]MPT59993.1 glutathione S-transferase [Alcaligenaceae bacterium]
MKLIGSLASPFVRKVRVVLAEKKLDYQFEQENVWAADSRIQDSNPLGKVPCLIMEDGGAVFDSRVIVEYLDTITPVCRLLPPSGRERSEVKCWEALADGLLDAAVLIRAEYTQRPEALRSESWIARQQGKIDAAVETMETGLGEKPFCAGNSYTLADVAVGCALGYLDFRYPERDWRDGHPNLARLAEKLAQRPSFADTDPRQG